MFCPNCGANVQGRFCAKCGTAVDVATSASAGPAASGPTGAPSAGPTPGAQAYGTAGGAQPYAAPVSTGGAMADNLAGALCYVLGLITGILFLVLAPYNQNKFIRFHAFQSIFFHAAWIVLWIVETMMAFVMPWYLMSLIGMLLALGGLAIWLILMFKAYNNERFKLPIIGDLAEKQA
jgi:uncharacterized membrane protein